MAILAGVDCLAQPMTKPMAFSYEAKGAQLQIYYPSDAPLPIRRIKLEAISDNIVHVQVSPEDTFYADPQLMVVARPDTQLRPQLTRNQVQLLWRLDSLLVEVDLVTGTLRFFDAHQRLLLAEKPVEGREFTPTTVGGESAWHIRQVFIDTAHDALFGLGENQLGLTNLKGQIIELAQHNTEAFVPFLVSTRGFGILWNNNSITHFGDPQGYQELGELKLLSAQGLPGALTATYVKDTVLDNDPIIRQENQIAYDFLPDLEHLPEGFRLSNRAEVSWTGSLVSPYSGEHRFLFTAGGYLKVWIDGKLVLDRWRQCWNPASTLISFPMQAGKPVAFRMQWRPDGDESFISVKWHKPLSQADSQQISFSSEVGHAIDYYLVYGTRLDSVIAGYRLLTGKAPIFPKWAYGFWQSREHYASQREILDIVARFRQLHVPLDNIVQDWFYWKKDQWGSQQFDSQRYPDPQGMIDSLHQQYHTHFMISVWPKFYETANTFPQFWNKGWLYRQNIWDRQKDWVGYVSTFYDAFNPKARRAFWDLVNRRLFSLGIDAWWLDASEPDILSNATLRKRKSLMNPTAVGPGAAVFNAYPLVNDAAFYEGQRQVDPHRRVFILTRSAWGGSQRYAAATWSGDIGATWQDMRNQIAAGMNFSLSGIPYWTMDIGGFATESRYQHPDEAARKEWQELMVRWYQFGAFSPLFRAHGQAPFREIFEVAEPGTEPYNAILYYDKLRYRLLPYVYSLAGDVYFHDYTLMRALCMDFPDDPQSLQVKDEYLFGPAMLVCPVLNYRVTTRQVYLPAGTGWYDVYQGNFYAGGQTRQVAAPLDRMPVFVRAGALVPLGPDLEYVNQKPADTLTWYVYTGADGQFDLYEDDGVSYAYEKGQYSRIPLRYRERDHVLTIWQREGSFPGMLQERVFRIRWVSPGHPVPLTEVPLPDDQYVRYTGQEIQLKPPQSFTP